MVDQETALDQFEEVARQREALRLTANLMNFVVGAWHVLETVAFVGNFHLDEIAKTLRDVEDGAIEKVIINQPPGTCKTRLLVFFVAYLLAKDPTRRILIATYGDKLSKQLASDIRTLLRSEWYKRLFRVRFKADQDEKNYFATVSGGWCRATSVGGEGQGLHPDFLIIDDPLKGTDAMTPAGRDEVWNWYRNTVVTRGMTRRVRIIASGQRLDVDDFFGRLLASSTAHTWTKRVFPMRYEKARPPTDQEPEGYAPDPGDPRTEEGQLLWPTLLNESKVQEKELELQEDAPAQLQQQPRIVGGHLFKVDMARYYDKLPPILKMVRGYDTGGTEGGGDPSCGVLMGQEVVETIENGVRRLEEIEQFYVIDVWLEQVGPENLGKRIVENAKKDGLDVSIRWEREGGSSGIWMSRDLERMLKDYDAEEVKLKGQNKVVRSKPFRGQWNQGHVFLPRGAKWVAPYLRELGEFRVGCAHDDQVDGSSCAFNAVLLEEIEEAVTAAFCD